MKAWSLAAALAALLGAAGAAAQAPPPGGQTLNAVRQRGQLVCGVSQGFAGFSAPDSRGEFRGLDVDYCRAVAAAVLGDPAKVRLVPLTAQARFIALQTGEIDVLFRNSTQTFLRDTSLGLNQGPVSFHDGQGFAVRRDSNVKRVGGGLDGATVCVAQGTTHELNLNDTFRARRLRFQPVVFERVDTMYEPFFAGRCDAMTQDASALAGALTVARDPAAYAVLEETISKEPLGSFTRSGDDGWSNIIFWTHHALVEAEELGVTRANAEERARGGDATAQRLLGATGGFGSRLGPDNRWALKAIRAVGSYGELFERNVGEGGPLKLRRGLNGLWTAGGLCTRFRFGSGRPLGERWQPATRSGVCCPGSARATRRASPGWEESRMDKDRIEGAAKQAKGAVKDVAGKVTGDTKMQAEGKADKAEGKAQNAVGGAKDTVRDATNS